MEKICVLGLGYIGLPTAALIGSSGYSVIGVDIDGNKVKRLSEKTMKIVEPGVEDLVYQAMKNGTFKVSEIPEEADAYIICVPTPITQENKVDLTHIYEALESILPYLKKGNVIIIESTIPPMTTSVDISHYLQAKGFEEGDLLLAHCPERAFPGQLLHELIHNDRLIGGVTEEATEKAVAIYKKFVKG